MVKTRIILLLAGIFISALLFLQPMVVVDNESEGVVMAEKSDVGENGSVDTDHDARIVDHGSSYDTALLEKINIQRDLLIASGNNEKSVTFADSLARLFSSVGKRDSVAKYKGWIADNFPNEGNIEAAGLAYYDAFGYAIDDGKVKLYGDKVRSYLGNLLEKNPERIDLKTKIAMTYISSQRPMQGIMMLREVVETDPNHQEALFNLGLLSRQSGQFEKAVTRFQQILTINPDHIQARFLLGVTWMDLGKNQKAKEQFEIVKRTDNDPAVVATVDAYLEEIN